MSAEPNGILTLERLWEAALGRGLCRSPADVDWRSFRPSMRSDAPREKGNCAGRSGH
jgi:hypothetical protein